MMFAASLIALFCWSGSDLFCKLGTLQNDKKSHLRVGAWIGIVMGIHALYKVLFGGVVVTLHDILVYLPVSVLYIGSMLLSYLGLRYIELSISSPICNTSGAFALILSMMWFGVKFTEDTSSAIFLSPKMIAGVLLIVVGLVGLILVDLKANREDSNLPISERKYVKRFFGLLIPVVYCFLDALGTFLDTRIADGYVTSLMTENPLMSAGEAQKQCAELLTTAYEFTWFFVSVICLIYLFVLHREKVSPKYAGARFLGGVFEAIGHVFYMMVLVSEYKVGLVIVSSYCILSVVWSRMFLKEKLSKYHYVTLAVMVAGIVLLGIQNV